jgi:allantoate deiminase
MVMERCDALGTCSEEAERLTRPFASDAMRRANEYVTGWMGKAGMVVHRDNVGNLRGRYESATPEAPTLLLGSHLDSVRDAGKYDGPLGVMVSIAAVDRLQDAERRLPFAIEVVAFADEEGLRFGSPYLGSRAVAGTFDVADLERTDAGDVTMAEAIRAFGGDPEQVRNDRWSGGELLGYVEIHIEQGPTLEARDLPVGVVSAIAGQSRYRLTFKGEAGHAGTVPMHARRDALAAAAELILCVEADARVHEGEMATIGHIVVQPGAANVIPGEAIISLDVRHPIDGHRAAAALRLLDRAQEIGTERGVDVHSQLIVENPSVPCSPRLAALLERAVRDAGHPPVYLASGAGHDVVPLSALTEVAMLFVRCKGGISHNPAESVSTADVAVAIDVLGRFLELLAQRD